MSLHQQATWFACGEMSLEEAAVFERLLANDQAARDALVVAVSQLAEVRELEGVASGGPSPAYREAVRRRLRRARRPFGLHEGVRRIVSGVLAAALLIVIAWGGQRILNWTRVHEMAPAIAAPPADLSQPGGNEMPLPTQDVLDAIHYADLSSPDDVKDRVRRFHKQNDQQKPRPVEIRNFGPKLDRTWPGPIPAGPM